MSSKGGGKRSVQHDTFSIERHLPQPPATVFAAWSDPRAKARWFVGPDDWESSAYRLDFRVGGSESVSGGPPGGTVHHYKACYQDIVPGERIVYTYDMHLDAIRISVSLATIEFRSDGKGTLLVLTEQGVFLDGYDDAGAREEGTHGLLDNLEAALRDAAGN